MKFNLILLNGVGVFLVGAASLAMPSGYSLGFYLISIVSLFAWLKVKGPLFPSEALFFLCPLVVYGLAFFLLDIRDGFSLRKLNPYMPFMLVIFGFWGLRKYQPNVNFLWCGLALGAIISSLIAAYQSIHLNERAGGFGNHPIQFGNIALLLGVLSLLRAIVVTRWGWPTVLMVTGFMAGMAASTWSQSRGGWLAVLLALFWVHSTLTKAWIAKKRNWVLAILIGVISIPVLMPNGIVQSRIREAATEVKYYFLNGKQDTSVGSRLAMWSVAIESIPTAPLLGQGDRGWEMVRDDSISRGVLSTFSSGFSHVHNEYLNNLIKKGILGLALYLGLYLVPMMIFFRPYINHHDLNVRSCALAGTVVPIMFMDFALTQAFLTHNSGRMMLVAIWMCLAALMLNAIEHSANFTHKDS